ncbi:MAG: hypothetical protein RSC78_06420 [Acidaminococcaceae bacterium]
MLTYYAHKYNYLRLMRVANLDFSLDRLKLIDQFWQDPLKILAFGEKVFMTFVMTLVVFYL